MPRINVINSGSDEDGDDFDGFATTLPVIIQIKVKSNCVLNSKQNRQNESFELNDDRHRSEKYQSHRMAPMTNRSNFWLNRADFWKEDDSRETWQIFERKPSDQFNKELRNDLSKSLMAAVSADITGSGASSPRTLLLTDHSESECQCEILPNLSIVEHFTDKNENDLATLRAKQQNNEQDVQPFSKVIEVTNSNGTLERKSGK